MIDSDSGFVRTLGNRLQAAGWRVRCLPEENGSVVVDLAVLGPHGWSYLERMCSQLPDMGVVVCTGSSSVAQRVRGLRLGADDWVSKPCHPDELMARLEAVVRRRRKVASRLGAARTVEIYQRVWGYEMAHGDRSVDVFVRKLRAKLQKVSPTWRYIHTHFGIGYRFAAEPVTGPEPDVPEPVDERERARA